ncbi:preprotein translocase subunit SecG [candidate division GN15 bacterium]|nr:preprotein translocase subunit SecG [candidate division GN15 bacterium]
MFVAWVIFHVLICIALVLVVLMQSSKGGGLAGTALGGGAGGGMSGAVFGGRGAASFLSKATTVLAVIFMFNCGALAFMSANERPTVGGQAGVPTEGESVVQQQAQREMQEQQRVMQQRQADSIANTDQGQIQYFDTLGPGTEGGGDGQ